MSEVEPDSTRPAPRHTDERPAHVTGDSARQSVRGPRVFIVLAVSMGAAALFGAIYWFSWYVSGR
jgi:hypothetical protein